MKTRLISLLLAFAFVLSVTPVSAFAIPGAELPETAFDGTVLKITTSDDFAAGAMENLKPVENVGNGAVTLNADAVSGTFVSQIYRAKDFPFNRLVATWNSSIYDGTEVEIWGRVRNSEIGKWSQWLSWGTFTPFDNRGGHRSMGEENGVASIDETLMVEDGLADEFQMMAEIRRDDTDCEAPVLRQITVSIGRNDGDYEDPNYSEGGKNEDNQLKKYEASYTYAEEAVEKLPLYTENEAVAYAQMKRHPSIGSDICNPTTVSVMMNSRVPSLDLLPEEYAENVRNEGSGIFGSWIYATSGAGMYGFESYIQYANLKIMLQELAQGRSVGISVKYGSTESSKYPLLDGTYSSTSGHIIALIGYVYEGEMEGGYLDLDSEDFDPAKLYIYSSDSFCDRDENAYRKYQWSQLESCWKNSILYIIPSMEQEANADVSGVVRVDAKLVENENIPDNYTLTYENGESVNMTRFISGRGRIGYTITDCETGETLAAPAPSGEDGVSIAYEWPIRVTANNRFFYDHITCSSDGSLDVDTNSILKEQDMSEADITVYAMSDRGYRYTAVLHAEIKAEEVISVTEDVAVTNSKVGNHVTADVAADGIADSAIKLGLWIPDGADVGETVSYTLNGKALTTSAFYTDPYDFEYAVVELDSSELITAEIEVDWGNGIERTYTVNLLNVVLAGQEIAVVKGVDGSVVHADLSAGRISSSLALQNDGSLALQDGETYGEYYSPVYNTEKWNWEYALGNLNAYTPGTSVAELQVRAFTERAQAWSDWYSFGTASVGQPSVSFGGKDDYVNMDTDVFTMRGSSSIANGQKFQIRVILTGDGEQQPVLFNAGMTIKKSSYSAAESVDSLNIVLPESAEIKGVEAYSTYAYRVKGDNNNIVYRENYPYKASALLSALNGQDEDLLFEEVAFAAYDWDLTDFNNWTMLGFTGGKFGHEAYTQYGASADMVRRVIAQGKLPIVLGSGKYLKGTSSNERSMTVVYGYYTAEDGTVMFKTVCPRGDQSELAAGDVYGEVSADGLNSAIANYSKSGGRGAMYVIGKKTHESSWVRETAETAADESNDSFCLIVDGETVKMPADFENYSNFTEGGTITYTLASETPAEGKLARGKFHYDLDVNSDGSITVSEVLKDALLKNDTATVYVICANGITYTAELTHSHVWDNGERHSHKTVYTCEVCDETMTVKDDYVITPVGPDGSSESASAEDVAELIDKIPAPAEITAEDREIIEAARKAYDGLSADSKKKVKNYSELVEAEKALAALPAKTHAFVDVPPYAWFADPVDYVYAKGLMTGISDTLFDPYGNTTRGMIVTILWRMNGQPAPSAACRFADVAKDSWYESAVAWAAENGIVNGCSETEFKPDANITREQLAAMLFRYAQYKGYDVSVGESTNILSYTDSMTVSGYAIPAMQWACGAGLINGIDGALQPAGFANRAQAAAILARFCQAF